MYRKVKHKMSDSWLIFIPTDPQYVPDVNAYEKALSIFRVNVSIADEVRVKLHDEIEFIDAGVNFESIQCPVCSSSIEMDWWLQKMDETYTENKFTDLIIQMPCCNSFCSLNDLCYDWPCGFALFSLEARNPATDLGEQVIHQMEVLLQCKLRKIWGHL